MAHAIAWIFERLLRLLLPARGCHRQAGAPPAARCEDVPLVRPYVLTPEEQQERRAQRGRRRALWLASHGIDAGPRRIHGVEVTA